MLDTSSQLLSSEIQIGKGYFSTNSNIWARFAIDQFLYIKIQPNTIDLSTRFWGNTESYYTDWSIDTSSIAEVNWFFTFFIGASLLYVTQYTGRSIFSLVSQKKKKEWGTHCEFVSDEFSTFSAEIWRKCWKKAVSGNFYFLFLSKVMTILVKRAMCQDRNQTSHQNFLTPF